MTFFTKKLALFLFISSFVFLYNPINLKAQKLENGYVVSKNGKKFEGQIPGNEWEVYSRLVAFKFKNQSKILKPTEISEFGFEEGAVYKAFNLDFDYASKSGILHHYQADRFLRQLTFGEIQIFELRDMDVRAWFIQKGDNSIQFLSNIKKLKEDSKMLLKKALADCNSIDWDYEQPMKIGVAIELIEEYNDLANQAKDVSTANNSIEEVTPSQQ